MIFHNLIDAADDLSVQVHPSDAYALEHKGQFGKTEMWYILDAEESAGIYSGFKRSVTREEKETADSRWIFASPNDPDVPRYPTSISEILSILLKRAGCKHVRFHDLRHTFATMALENGMDAKTLSATIGHVSAATTLDIYSHMTDTMQMQAAVSIDRIIGKTDARMPVVEQNTRRDGKTARKRPVCAHRAASRADSEKDTQERHGMLVSDQRQSLGR